MKNKKLTKFEVLGFSNNSSTSTIVETRPYFYNEFPTFSKNLKLLIVLLLGIILFISFAVWKIISIFKIYFPQNFQIN